MITIYKSSETILLSERNNDKIYLIYQYYLDKNSLRNQEIKECLLRNINNIFIDHIYLLNEEYYDNLIENNKVTQINIKKRFTFSDFFDFIDKNNLKGYCICINADIFLDHTINIIKFSDIHLKKKIFALLRYEYDENNSTIFGPRYDSQDTWIIHSNFNIPLSFRQAFNFYFGIPGCDNKFIYLIKILGYEIYNDPILIHTYHLHKQYSRKIRSFIKKPYAYIIPSNYTLSTEIIDNIEDNYKKLETIINKPKKIISSKELTFKTEILPENIFRIFENIYTFIWTKYLENKRVLVITNYNSLIKNRLHISKEIYNIDFFDKCKLSVNNHNPDIILTTFQFSHNCLKYLKMCNTIIIIDESVLLMYWGIVIKDDYRDIINMFYSKKWIMLSNINMK